MNFIKHGKIRAILRILIALVLLAGSLAILPTTVMADTPPSLTAGNVSGAAGDTLQVPITLTSPVDVTLIGFDLVYDSTQLTYQSISKGTMAPSALGVSGNAHVVSGNHVVTVLIVDTGALTPIPSGSGCVAQLQFRVNVGVSGGQTSPLALNEVVLSDDNGDPITTTTTNGQFNVPLANYTVNFESNGGSAVTAITQAGGTTIATAQVSTKTGFFLEGWYTEAAMTHKVTFPYTITTNATLYAKWIAVSQSTISFDENGGSEVTDITRDTGATIDTAPVSIKAHYTLEGWYTEASLTDKVNFPYTITSNATLYAKWTAAPCTVIFMSDGAVYLTVNAEVNTAISAPIPPNRSGYNFAGWYFDAAYTSIVTFPYTVTADIPLCAKWTLDFAYTTTGYTATITGYTGYGGAVTIPGAFTTGGNTYTVTAIADGTSASTSVFKNGKTTITSITIPDSLTTIGAYAFYNCTVLTSVTMGNNVTSIGARAFYKAGLTSLDVPDNASLGDNAVYQCTALTSVTLPGSITLGSHVFDGCSGLTSLTLENGLTRLGDYEFYGCTGLTAVTIPNTVTSLGQAVFYGSGLTSITIPASVTSIGSGAFRLCTGLTSVALENGPKDMTIADVAFYGCNKLASIVIPDRVKSLGPNAFSGCTALTSVTLPNSLTIIDILTFDGCTVLTSINIPACVTAINGNAFRGCTGLTSITLPTGLTNLGATAFSGCSHLAAAYFPGAKPSFGTTPFTGTASGFTLYYHVSQSAFWSGYTAYNATPYCTLTLNRQDDSNPTSILVVVTGGHICAPSDPTLSGYTFGGWYKEAGCINIFDFNTETVTNDVTVYAKWTENVTTYTLTYTAGDHGSINGASYQTVSEGNSGNAVTAEPDSSYHFVQWSDGSTANPRIDTNVTANLSVTATFALNPAGNSQTWYLNRAGKMGNTQGSQSGTVEVSSTPMIWLSDKAATTNVTFPSGNWTLQLNATASTYKVQVGQSDGTTFSAFNEIPVSGTLTSDGILTLTITTDGMVQKGNYLALSITGDCSVTTDGSSYLVSPSNDPGYPLPELTGVVLLALGLAGLGGFVIIRRKRITVPMKA